MDWNKISFASESCIWHINFILLFCHHNEYILSVLVFGTFTCPVTLQNTSKHNLKFMLVTELQHCQNNRITKHRKTVFLHFQRLFVVWQATISGHLTLASLVATYENHSCKQPAPVTDTSRVCTYDSFHCIITKSSCNVSPYKKRCRL